MTTAAKPLAYNRVSMAIAIPLSSTPPEECPHPDPVQGVMAHEFAHYERALGPEGARRTVTYYGPVVGGLPISAWHCEECGLLRLAFPDGRREERRLFPGTQPGLISLATVVAPESIRFGQQPRVSGLSAPEPLYEELYSEELGATAVTLRLPQVELPKLDLLGWVNVTGLLALCLGLLYTGVAAVAGNTLPQALGSVVATLGGIFVVLVVINALAPAWRRVFPMPPLTPPLAVTQRGRPVLDIWDHTAISLFVVAALLLLLVAVLATYTYEASSLAGPVFILGMAAGVGAAAALIAGSFVRRSRRD